MDDSTACPKGLEAGSLALEELRFQIDGVDRRLLALLTERAQLAQQVGHVKARDSLPVFRPDREAAVIEALRQANTGPLQSSSITPIWREIMSACRALETPVRVAFLGPAGTFSELATLQYFGSSIEAQPCITIDDVFHAVEKNAADFGLAPIENSTEGMVARSLDLLLQSPLTIVGETSLLVQHNLLRVKPSLDDVDVVLGHSQALAQCHQWLSKYLPNIERRAVSSNAEGARLASADASFVAVASTRAASMYGLHIIQAAVQDEVNNRTRFVVISRADKVPAVAPSGNDCTSLVAAINNRPGALHDMLMPLKQHGVSMTRLESRPARSGQWEYLFFIDLAGHASNPALAQALLELRSQCRFFKLLGSFPIDAY